MEILIEIETDDRTLPLKLLNTDSYSDGTSRRISEGLELKYRQVEQPSIKKALQESVVVQTFRFLLIVGTAGTTVLALSFLRKVAELAAEDIYPHLKNVTVKKLRIAGKQVNKSKLEIKEAIQEFIDKHLSSHPSSA